MRGQRKAVRYCFINYSPGNGSFRNGQVGGRDHFRDRGCFWGHWLTLLIFFLPSTCRTNLFSVAPSEGFVLSLCSSALSYLKGLRQLGVTSLSSPPSFL